MRKKRFKFHVEREVVVKMKIEARSRGARSKSVSQVVALVDCFVFVVPISTHLRKQSTNVTVRVDETSFFYY